MYRIAFILRDVAVAAIFTVPIGLVFGYFVTHSKRKSILLVLLSLYLTAVLSAVGFPNIRSLIFDPSVNLIPIIDIVNNPIAYLKNELLNIILFIPFGFFLPTVWGQDYFTRGRTVALGLGFSIFIEVSQLFTFRLTDIDDIITNTLGTLLGFCLFLLCRKHCAVQSAPSRGKMSAGLETLVVFSYTILIMFFAAPYIG